MENYFEFIERVNSFEVPTLDIDVDHFEPSESVRKKVGLANRFSQFFGDTIVFDLPEDVKKRVAEMAKTIRVIAKDCFCESLHDNTFHMTLHDLSNGEDELAVSKRMEKNLSSIKDKLHRIPLVRQEIAMKTNYIINMVNTSLVLTLLPKDEGEYEKLIALYRYFDEIYELPYPFTPHITLGYYSRNRFARKSGMMLKKAVEDYNESGFEFVLDTSMLYYQRFTSMNDFFTIFHLVE